MKRQRQTELPRFIVGALATAGVSAANGATVQITLLNNYVANTAHGGFTQYAVDLTRDGVSDYGALANSNAAVVFDPHSPYFVIFAFATQTYTNGSFNVGAWGNGVKSQSPVTVQDLARITFSDSRINQGALSYGLLDITSSASSGNFRVQINRLIFDDASQDVAGGITAQDAAYTEWTAPAAVPEPGSLALLALGAGGLMMRRRRSQAA